MSHRVMLDIPNEEYRRIKAYYNFCMRESNCHTSFEFELKEWLYATVCNCTEDMDWEKYAEKE